MKLTQLIADAARALQTHGDISVVVAESPRKAVTVKTSIVERTTVHDGHLPGTLSENTKVFILLP